MKNKKILSAILATITVLTCSSNIVSAEETTEATTESVTEVTSEITTEITNETTAATEETTVAIKTTIVGELSIFDTWTGGDFSKTINLGTFGYDFGAFANLMLHGAVIDRSNYTVSQNGNESITFTISAAFMSTLSADTNYFTADFEKVAIRHAFAVDMSDVNENATKEYTTDVVTNKKTASPKTADKGMDLLLGVLTVSGLTAFLSKKRV